MILYWSLYLKKTVFLLRDYNAKLSKHEKNSPTTEFLDSVVSSVSSFIVQPISNWKTVINNIFSNISTDIRYASSTPLDWNSPCRGEGASQEVST